MRFYTSPFFLVQRKTWAPITNGLASPFRGLFESIDFPPWRLPICNCLLTVQPTAERRASRLSTGFHSTFMLDIFHLIYLYLIIGILDILAINIGYKMIQIYSNAMTLCRNLNPWISTLPFPAKWHQCRLAWAGTPHQAHALPRTDAEGDTAQHLIQNAGEIRLYMASMGFQLCTHKIHTHIYILHMYIYILMHTELYIM